MASCRKHKIPSSVWSYYSMVKAKNGIYKNLRHFYNKNYGSIADESNVEKFVHNQTKIAKTTSGELVTTINLLKIDKLLTKT